MKIELKEQLKDIIFDGLLNDQPVYDIVNKIADLIDGIPATDIDTTLDELSAQHERFDKTLDEHFAMIDKITRFIKSNM